MWFNQAKCDIYIGTGAGTKLLHEIANAQRSVKIISPLSLPEDDRGTGVVAPKRHPSTVDYLRYLGKHESQTIGIIRRLIVQERNVDESAQKVRYRWGVMGRYSIVASVLLTVVSCYLLLSTKNLFYLAGFGIPVLGYLWSKNPKRKIQRKRIYTYRYRPLFPFRAFIAPDRNKINDKFIHGKVYSIDEHTAYMGSLNFTESGTKHNYETRIRVTDSEAVAKIEQEFNELFHDADMAFFGVGGFGKKSVRRTY